MGGPLRFVTRGRVLVLAMFVLIVVAPFFLEQFWLQLGALAMAGAIAAIGLDILVGVAGQISLAHAVFVGIGAYAYVALASPPTEGLWSLGLPPLVAAIGAVVIAGLAGLLISPLSARVAGLYLAVVTIGLVFVWVHFLNESVALSGGPSGRVAPELDVFGLSFGDSSPWLLGGVTFGSAEKLWLLAAVVLTASYLTAKNLVRGRSGLAWSMVKESEIAASALGINVGRARTTAFVVAAVYAGVAGVFIALITQYLTPQVFGFALSTDYLVMIIIGGLGSIRGAIAGAVFVTALPRVLGQYADALPFLAAPGQGGLDANVFSVFLYCVALIVVIMFVRGGLDRFIGWLVGDRARQRRRRPSEAESSTASA